MKRIVLSIAAGSLALLVFASLASAFGWKDVVKMHRAGIADSLIIQKIEYSGETFDLDADKMVKLVDEGVSDAVISAMLRTEAEEYDDYDRYDRYDRDYYYPHARAYVGWGYYYPRYSPYYVRGYYPYYGGYYGGYRYPRSYELHRRQGTSGDYGTTRERTRVEIRYNPRTQGGTTYRTPPPSSRSHSSPPRSSGGSTTRTRR